MGMFSQQLISLGGDVASRLTARLAEEQGGLLSGKDPTTFNASDPIRLWIIQLGIIITTTQLLSLLLSKLRQPRVIAEVICGIVLGPTLMGRVPGFTNHIFPDESRSYLNLTATIGLVLFLFLVGLEVDVQVIKRNARSSFIISIGAILLPLAIGFGMAVPIYKHFIDPSAATFSHFMLFVAVACKITAFPVLARILTEIKILDTTIGIVVLSAGVGNDIIGWTLLALSVALVNAGSGIEALYILLTAIGWTLVILIPVKKIMLYLARRTGSIEDEPSPLMMTVSIMVMFASAFFTDVIGIHAIFGAFLAGLAIPHEGGLAIALTEKLEDLTSIIFLPLYFTLSGLSTNLGLLNDGKTWGYTILIIITAYIGKAVGGTLGGRAAGFKWREACTIGTLLSCKGLVELIVLNIGLAAGILSVKVFSMFVLEALVLTFMTTPATLYLYPPQLRKRVAASGSNFDAVAEEGKTKPAKPGSESATNSLDIGEKYKRRLTIVLDKVEHLPSLMTIVHFLQVPATTPAPLDTPTTSGSRSPACFSPGIALDALRLIQLSERKSGMMKSAAAEQIMQTDPLLTMYRTFGDLHNLPVSSSISIIAQDSFAYAVANHARANSSEMVVLSWVAPCGGASIGTPAPAVSAPVTPLADSGLPNPFDGLFRTASAGFGDDPSILNTQFVRRVFAESTVDVALYVDRSSLRSRGLLGVGKGTRQHILLPFFGGPDDRLALAFVVQLCGHPDITATIIRMSKTEGSEVERPTEAHTVDSIGQISYFAAALRGQNLTIHSIEEQSAHSAAFPDTVYPRPTTQVRLESDTADNMAWSSYSSPVVISSVHSRIDFIERATPTPLHVLIDMMDHQWPEKRLMVAVGRARRLAAHSHRGELDAIFSRAGGLGLGRMCGRL
ncbi:hypothetical protein BS47DRAFT_1377479 [Hydnum rufescens UP504]|uniref:Cation/H+ exchanger transmembrane domain-containing protein n=1 Tax=Hydnum rufescens UP504 TaxID=1448309 RepID=A0A9P6DT30_9AGAM|nr:hypothetical protein BS47DRAFT_1377479 [Hydnum rufescens UP504]